MPCPVVSFAKSAEQLSEIEARLAESIVTTNLVQRLQLLSAISVELTVIEEEVAEAMASVVLLH